MPPSTAFSPSATQPPTLLLTGYYRKRRHRVVAFGKVAALTENSLMCLLDLCVGVFSTKSGFSSIPSLVGSPETMRLVIHRLRRDLAVALGDVVPLELITNNGRTHYRLALASSEIAGDPSFFELASPEVVSTPVMDVLVEHLPVWNLVELQEGIRIEY